MLSAIVFDLDDTLIDRSAALAAWLRAHVRPCDVERLVQLDRQTRGTGQSRARWHAALAMATSTSPRIISARLTRELPQLVLPTPGSHALVEQLAAHYRLAVGTNGTSHMQRAKWEHAGFARRIPALFVSQELGVKKPSRAFFRLIEKALDVAPDRILMVGDHPTEDIAGARAAGWRTCWLWPTDPAALAPDCDVVLSRLTALAELVDVWH